VAQCGAYRGQAQALPEVFPLHTLPTGKTIPEELNAQEGKDLLGFLNAIDGTTDPLRSEGDEFRDALRSQVPHCPSPPPGPAQSRVLPPGRGR
jgi:hypothetical protein